MKINVQGYDVECTPFELVEFLILQDTVQYECDCDLDECGLCEDCDICEQCTCELDYECAQCNENCQCDECNYGHLFDSESENEIHCSCEECRANGILEELDDELDEETKAIEVIFNGIKYTFN